MPSEVVRVLDREAQRLFTIPAGELAPGMIRVRLEGIDGEVWVDASEVHDAPLRHGPLSEELRQGIRIIQEVFNDVRPLSFEEWEDGFRRDTHPENEIAIWLSMAGAFQHFTQGRRLYPDQKLDIFRVIVTFVNNGPDYVLRTMNPVTLSRKRVKEMVDVMRSRSGGG